jgi:hypothetical protein
MSYAVLWNEDEGPTLAGKLELIDDAIRLEGTNGHAVRLSLPLGAVTAAHIGRTPTERLQGRPVLVIELRGGRRVRVATLSGAGALHELADAVGGR